MKFIVLFLTVLLFNSSSFAHDKWKNGDQVPKWVKTQCCGPEDVHNLTPDQVHQTPEGYKIDGYPIIVPYEKALPSQDGDYWAFYRVNQDNSVGPMYCFFVPMNF